ncbi:SRPBCC family protein [Kitasatospora sp. NBC_01287]|uniref:SRPBCC family protein n=1 Tax=Kitasatospora sp. NBC_01287 TaxID=2903573 RepID=UPI002257FE81|nr:SRPBCC family protein [Kitasatospora sp. NBC_01287]MCX4746230.1 SRPBCC family protein [Kitasatospora sp. NBC_01287]
MESNRYHLTSNWQLPAPPRTVYRALRDVEHYPRWWREVREVSRLDDRTGRLRIRSVLPYELLLTARERRQDEHPAGRGGVLEAELTGDLVGWSRWTVAPDGARGSLAVFEEEVSGGATLMRLFARPGRPFFLANHALMMRSGLRGLRRHLAARPTD